MRAFNPFRPRPRADGASASGRIKGWTRAALGLDEAVAISVLELPCAAPGCPPRSTAILVLFDAATARRAILHVGVDAATEADVRAAWAEAASGEPL